ncbi:Ubiquitin-conjugating enzyme 15 [Zea mays]|nr:Ubiquitin-conjugating enzyme 15 [Zea mays]
MASPSSSSFPSRKALSKIACRRLQKELTEWQVNPPAGFEHRVTDNLQRCRFPIAALPIPFLTKQSLR